MHDNAEGDANVATIAQNGTSSRQAAPFRLKAKPRDGQKRVANEASNPFRLDQPGVGPDGQTNTSKGRCC